MTKNEARVKRSEEECAQGTATNAVSRKYPQTLAMLFVGS